MGLGCVKKRRCGEFLSAVNFDLSEKDHSPRFGVFGVFTQPRSRTDQWVTSELGLLQFIEQTPQVERGEIAPDIGLRSEVQLLAQGRLVPITSIPGTNFGFLDSPRVSHQKTSKAKVPI
jgi:hypothetical protein